MDKLYIIILAYNEEENIEIIVKQWHKVVENIGADSRLIVIDDGSKDKRQRPPENGQHKNLKIGQL